MVEALPVGRVVFVVFAAVAVATTSLGERRSHDGTLTTEERKPVGVVARDFRIELPRRAPAGMVTFRFQNRGHEPHYLRLVRIDGDHSLREFEQWRRDGGGPLPAWLIPAGGIGTIAAGESVEYAAPLIAGDYIAYCGHPSPDGVQHVDKGMYAEFTLDAATTAAEPPSPVSTVSLSDDGIDISRAFGRGLTTVRVRNAGSRPHQALLVKLPEGVTVESELEWFRGGSRGARPGHPVGGVIEIAARSDAWVTFNLPTGSYVLLSSIVWGGRREFDLGLVRTFQID